VESIVQYAKDLKKNLPQNFDHDKRNPKLASARAKKGLMCIPCTITNKKGGPKWKLIRTGRFHAEWQSDAEKGTEILHPSIHN